MLTAALVRCPLLRSLMEAKRTLALALHMSAYDPKRTFASTGSKATALKNRVWGRRRNHTRQHQAAFLEKFAELFLSTTLASVHVHHEKINKPVTVRYGPLGNYRINNKNLASAPHYSNTIFQNANGLVIGQIHHHAFDDVSVTFRQSRTHHVTAYDIAAI